MKKLFLFILWLIVGCVTIQAVAACHAVTPSGAGAKSGASWSNAMSQLPATLVRGDTYYVADGNYAQYHFTTPNSGTTTVTIKKAQSYDFGRSSDGCSNDISEGWSAATMGSDQAMWPELFGDGSTPQPGYFILDGNGRSQGIGCGQAPSQNLSASDCGLRVSINSIGQDSGFDIGQNNNDGQHRSSSWTLRYFEIQGGGDGNNGAQSEEEIRCRGGCDNFVVENSYLHLSGCDFFKVPWTTSFVVQNTYINQNISSATCHGQLWYTEVQSSGVDFHSNIIQDIQGTGIWVCLTGCQASGWNIYNNIIWRPEGDSRPGTANGIFSCINPGNHCTNMSFVGNSVVNYTADYAGALGIHCDGTSPNTFIWKNNLFYGITPNDRIDFQLCGGSLTEDHNSYLNSGTPLSGISSTDVVVPALAPNPFVDWPHVNFQLTSQNTDWTDGAVLAAPYNVDAAGNARPGSDGVWDRGAYQSMNSSQTPAPPTNLRSVVH
jgi:hypothetical protein